MRGVSEVIAIILILMITVAIAGLAYTFMSGTMASTTSTASSTVSETTTKILTSFRIESIEIAKMFIKNTGQNPITSLSVYVNNEPAVFNMSPSTISPGQIGSVTIYSFIPDGATVKVMTPSGFSASKTVTPCAKAIGCWKFDEASGGTVYDSSPSGISGTIYDNENNQWIGGKYGTAFQSDGVDDYIELPNRLQSDYVSVEAWVYIDGKNIGHHQRFVQRVDGNNFGGWTLQESDGLFYFYVYVSGSWYFANAPASTGQWKHLVGIYNGSVVRLYVDEALSVGQSAYGALNNPTSPLTRIMRDPASTCATGKIDEVRIYDRAIY